MRFYRVQSPRIYFDRFQLGNMVFVRRTRELNWVRYVDIDLLHPPILTRHVTSPQPACLDNVKIRVTLALKNIMPCESALIEGVEVFRSSRALTFDVWAIHDLEIEDAVAAIVAAAPAREREATK